MTKESVTLGLGRSCRHRLIRFSTQVSPELMRRALTTYFTEWCATRSQRAPGVCFEDMVFVYNDDDATRPPAIYLDRRGPDHNI